LQGNDLERKCEKLRAAATATERENEAKASKFQDAIDTLKDKERKLMQERDTLRRAKDRKEGGTELLAAKDQQIAAVLKEGEMLSKKQGVQVETIRKLRKEITEKDRELENRQTLINKGNERINELSESLSSVTSGDSQKADIVASLNSRNEDINSQLLESQSSARALDNELAEIKTSLEVLACYIRIPRLASLTLRTLTVFVIIMGVT
jgi:chromosome segregation ATPase